MREYTYSASSDLFSRAGKVIPCGIYGHFAPAPYVPVSAYPFFSAKARGSKFWDVDGNEFIDYMCGYGPMILGYGHPAVDGAHQKQLGQSDLNSVASPKMVELAERLVDLIDIAEWAFFAKNGSDVVNYATTIARSATGRDKIVAIRGGYHGTTPWMQAPGHHGVRDADHVDTIRIPWNDVGAFEQVINAHPGDVAGFLASPYHHPIFEDNALPAEGYWEKIQGLCKKNGIVLICDDVRCGFRLDMRGSGEHFGFKPDLAAYCKAIANGYPISALVGTEAMRTEAAKVFHTGSYWYQAAPMAAALACLDELERIDAPAKLHAIGTKLNDGLVQLAKDHGYNLLVSGNPCMAYYRLTDDPSLMLHQDWCAACTQRGAFFASHHNWFVSTAHTDEDIQRTWDIAEEAFKVVKEKHG
jgi:glutamate-1-semialdehyde 2,1-aminomutase